MPYTDVVLRRARTRLAEARQSHERENDERIQRIYEEYPRLRELDRRIRATTARAALAAFRKGEGLAEEIEKLKTENLALQRERRELMDAAGLTEADVRSAPLCPECGGTGYIGARMCSCLKNICREEQTRELTSLLSCRGSFETFQLDLYPSAFDPKLRASPRALMGEVFSRCKQYATHFSEQSPSLLFSGGTGLGKTFLSAAVARTVAGRGFSVVYETAGKVFSDFEREKFGGAEDLTHKYLECDLMILDDLGSEMTTQFTFSALYSLLNGRILNGRPFLVSTNLTTGEILKRYTPQIASRLLGSCELLAFAGDDIRMK